MSEKMTLTIGEGGAEVEVEFSYSPYRPSTRYEPAEQETVDIEAVIYKGVDIVDAIHYSGLEDIEDKICKAIERQAADYEADRGDYLYHAMKDEGLLR